jgi:hypothetical protein
MFCCFNLQPLDVEAHGKKGDKSLSDSESTSGSETGSTETDSEYAIDTNF